MKRLFLLSILSLVLVGLTTNVQAQKEKKKGYYLLGASVFTTGVGFFVYDIMKTDADQSLEGKNNANYLNYVSNSAIAGNTNNATIQYQNSLVLNKKSYNLTMKTATYFRASCSMVGLVLAIAATYDLVESDGSVTVASTNKSRLSFASKGSQMGLCLNF